MGKAEEEQSLSAYPASDQETGGPAVGNAGSGCLRCRWLGRALRPRCLAALALGVAVLLSAVFWLPPFLRDGAGTEEQRPQFETNIVASFQLQKPVSQLIANIPELQYDIFQEIGVANSSVVLISLETLPPSNFTNVVFGICPHRKNLNISSAGFSFLRSSFVSLVTQESTLHLTSSLFGSPSFFQVLEFPGGITIIPPQSGFLLQKPQILFNFTLNFSIYQVRNKINELKDQMISGLHLTSFEILYVSLTNVRGSTVTPPTVVQTSILLAVGNHPPSQSRLKELAHAITPAKNLGLNNTVFGRVKQIHLSSFLQHSINSSGSSDRPWSPSSAPQPHPGYQHHDYHHHHPDVHLIPASSPQYKHGASPPGCQTGHPQKSKSRSHLDSIAPSVASHHYSAHRFQGKSPAPVSVPHPESSPIPNVLFAQVQPPSEHKNPVRSPDRAPSS